MAYGSATPGANPELTARFNAATTGGYSLSIDCSVFADNSGTDGIDQVFQEFIDHVASNPKFSFVYGQKSQNQIQRITPTA